MSVHLSLDRPIQYPSSVEGLPEEEYHARPEVSSSALRELARTPRHCWWYMRHGKKATSAMKKGESLHLLLLEPDFMESRVAVSGMTRNARYKEYQEWLAANPGKIDLQQAEYDSLLYMRDALMENAITHRLLSGGKNEVSLFWESKGVQCRGRVDKIHLDHKVIVDIKTACDASPRAWRRKTEGEDSLLYIQEGHYRNGAAAVFGQKFDFCYVVVENKPPHCVAVYHLSSESAAIAEEHAAILVEKYAACQATGSWPGYHEELQKIELSTWTKEKVL